MDNFVSHSTSPCFFKLACSPLGTKFTPVLHRKISAELVITSWAVVTRSPGNTNECIAWETGEVSSHRRDSLPAYCRWHSASSLPGWQWWTPTCHPAPHASWSSLQWGSCDGAKARLGEDAKPVVRIRSGCPTYQAIPLQSWEKDSYWRAIWRGVTFL